MMKNYVVTISRGYGSGGKYIATKLAEELGIKLMDKDIIKLASLKSGISEEVFAQNDEIVRKSLIEKRKTSVYDGFILPPQDKEFTSKENLFSFQARVLLEMAQKENFVVLGRAGNYILHDMPNVISVNIQAPLEDCLVSIMSKKNLVAKDAIKEIKRIDKSRAEYYRHHTGGLNWLDFEYYDLCLNSSRIGRDRCVEVIKDYILRKTKIDPRTSGLVHPNFI